MNPTKKVSIIVAVIASACVVVFAFRSAPSLAKSFLAVGNQHRFRQFDHVEGAAANLADGRILMAGWQSPRGPMTAEIYSPSDNSYKRAADLSSPRCFSPVMTTLIDGRILIVGGSNPNHADVETIEAYDSSTDVWVTIGKIPRETRISDAVTLASGLVLFTTQEGAQDGILLFDPSNGTIKAVGHPSMVVNGSPLETLLPNGNVLITHLDYGSEGAHASNAFLYNPIAEKTESLGHMSQGRQQHQATLLLDGRVLITGGSQGTPSAEIFDPMKMTFIPVGEMIAPRAIHRSVLLKDGRVLIVGGVSSEGHSAMPDPSILKDKTPEEIVKIMKSIPTPKLKPLAADAEIFDPHTNTFTPISPLPSPIYVGMGSRTGVSLSLANGEVLFMSLRGPLLFVPESNTWRFQPRK